MAVTVTALSGNDGVQAARRLADQINEAIGSVILGKPTEIRLALSCLLAGGHLLIEDVPGVGKTLLARSLATVLGLSFRRIQFTSDMLPADVVGLSIFEQSVSAFRFHPGPIFTQVLLADEINRATPKAQSALLEAMEEHQVTADGQTHALPVPFFVIATQNPQHQVGTFPLPESQLDRFLMRLGLGYPSETLERKLLRGDDRRALLRGISPVIGPEDITSLQARARAVHVSDALLDYAQALVRASREAPEIALGLSPRAGQDLINVARSWALIHGHSGVHPEDVKAVFTAVASHRLHLRQGLPDDGGSAARRILESVEIP